MLEKVWAGYTRYIPLSPISPLVKATSPKHMNVHWLATAGRRLLCDSISSFCYRLLQWCTSPQSSHVQCIGRVHIGRQVGQEQTGLPANHHEVDFNNPCFRNHLPTLPLTVGHFSFYWEICPPHTALCSRGSGVSVSPHKLWYSRASLSH